MTALPQELRISSMVVSFDNKVFGCTTVPNVTVKGAAVTFDGTVCEFLFCQGKIDFSSKRGEISPFNKTVIIRLEEILKAYIQGVLHFDTIRCNLDYVDDVEPMEIE